MKFTKYLSIFAFLALVSGTILVLAMPGQGGWNTTQRPYTHVEWCEGEPVYYTITSCEVDPFDFCHASTLPAYPCFAGTSKPDASGN